MAAKKDIEFEIIEGLIDSVDEQIKKLQDSKPKIFAAFGITHQTYYNRKHKKNSQLADENLINK